MPLRLRDFAAVVMHTPFCKLVRKAHAWLSAADSVLAQGRTDVWQALSAQASPQVWERSASAVQSQEQSAVPQEACLAEHG